MGSAGLYEKIAERALVCDGAMGTMLQRSGLSSGDCPELWNVSNPDAVDRVHKAYADAGSDIVETNTFGGTRIKLASYGLEDRMVELNSSAAAIAKKSGVLVAGSIGPTGKLLEPYGDLTLAEAAEAYKEQVYALAEAGVDLFILETFSDINELKAALAEALSSGLPVAATMAFDTGGRTMMGVSPRQFAEAVKGMKLLAIGANCGGGPEQMCPIADELIQYTDIPLILQPNAGLPKLIDGKTVYLETPDTLARFTSKYKGTKVRIFGGCCGSGPEHIQAIANVLKG